MTEKRFYVDKSGDLWDRQSNDLLMQDFGYCEAIYVNAILDLLNGLYEEKEICENEIARLELIINKLKDKDFENYTKKIQELQEENRKLKKELEECNYLCFNCEFSGNFEIECWCDKAEQWVDCKYDCEDFEKEL